MARLEGRIAVRGAGCVVTAATLLLGTWAAGAGTDAGSGAFFQEWQVLGPVPIGGEGEAPPDEAAQRKAFAADLLAACGGEAQLGSESVLACTVDGKALRLAPATAENGVLDLAKAVARQDYAIAYAVTTVDSPGAARAVLAVGSDDAVKVWLNGELVHENWVQRALQKDQDVVALKLRRGRNRLVMKVENGTADWGVAARLLGRRGIEEAVWQAAKDGGVDRIQLLLGSAGGADVDAKAKYGVTAWQIARIFGQPEAAELLAAKGANTALALPAPETLVDAILSEATRGRSSGAAVLVSQGGKVLFDRGYGYADVEHSVKITPATKFRIGSITKQFTATAILRLQEQGKLEVTDPLSKYVPGFPKGDEITLQHLLTHTSGLHSYTDRPDFIDEVTSPIDPAELVASFKDDGFDFEPGTRFAYCNSGYVLLGRIVEKVSGQSYGDFLRTEIFAPLGMKDTGVHTRGAALENEATGHGFEDGKVEKAPDWDMSWAGGAGALYSTVGDLDRWNEAVFGGKVLSAVSLRAAFTPGRLKGSETAPEEGYGYGWFVGRLRGTPEIQHGGGLQGFLTQLSRYPEQRLTVVVLTNAAPPVPGLLPNLLAQDIAQIFMKDALAPRVAKRAIELPEKTLQAFVGRYDYGRAVLAVTREGGRLFAQLAGQPRIEIFASSENEFFSRTPDAQVTFVRDGSGRVVKIVHHQGGGVLEAPRLEDLAVVAVAPEVLDAVVGKYDYGQGRVLVVTRNGDRLFAQMTGQPQLEIFPLSDTRFAWRDVAARIAFVKNAAGRVTGAVHEQGGQRLEVVRVD